jgi:hypothetical protein
MTTGWYDVDAMIWNSTTNASAMTINANGELYVTYHIRANTSYDDLNDRGIIFLVDAPNTEWDLTKAVAKINGVTVANDKSLLNADENIAYGSTYEYAYVYSGDQVVDSVNEMTFELHMIAAAGANPSTDINVDIAQRGLHASTANAVLFKTGAVLDDAGKTQLHALWDTTLNIA